MRTETITLTYYKFHELSPAAQKRAIEDYRERYSEDAYPLDEVMQSLKGIFEVAGIKLLNWSIGSYNPHNYVRFDLGDAENLTGARALGWLENNLLSRLRISRSEWLKRRRDYLKYGRDYRQGKIRPCPITGICYDEDFLEDLQTSIKDGATLKDAFKGLADKAGQILDSEYEYRNSDAVIQETLEANEFEFTEDGKRTPI